MDAFYKRPVRWFTQSMLYTGTLMALAGIGSCVFTEEHTVGLAGFGLGVILVLVAVGIARACGVIDESKRDSQGK